VTHLRPIQINQMYNDSMENLGGTGSKATKNMIYMTNMSTGIRDTPSHNMTIL